MVEVVEMCKGCVGEAFEKLAAEIKTGERIQRGEKEEEENRRPKGGEGVLWDVWEGDKQREAPPVQEFQRLSLLGR